jgi:hypothetical protein
MFCSQCSTHILFAEGGDADEVAVASLTRQAKNASGVMATLIRARRDQIQAEIKAEKVIERAFKKAQSELFSTIEQAVSALGPQALLNASDQQLFELLLAGGLDDAIDKFIIHQQTIREAVNKTLLAANIELDTIGTQVDILGTQNVSDVFENIILNSVKQSINDSLTDLIVNVPVDTVMSNMQKRMQRAEGRQLTEIKTKLSQFGRSITAIAAEEADIDHFLYTGPDDGITRDFCEALVNKVVTSKQMRRLDNGQSLSVITSGGGYNCRHSWSPVTQGFIKSANLELATAKDINKANQ